MAGLMKKSFVLESLEGRKLEGDYRYTDNDIRKPVVIVSHGFKGYRDWGFLPYVCECLATAGLIAISFDYSCNGIRDREKQLYDVDLFASNTVTKELEDLNSLIRLLKTGKLLDSKAEESWNGEIMLLGHSLGGAISILTASGRDDISKIALWASIAKLDRHTVRQKHLWARDGNIEFENTNTGQMLRLNYSFLKDIEDNFKQYDLPAAMESIGITSLIIHGKQDMTVPLMESQILADAAKKDICGYHIIEKTGHLFGAVHPFVGTTKALEEMLEITIGFLK